MCKQILHCNQYIFLPTERSFCGTRIRTVFKTFFLLRDELDYLFFTYSSVPLELSLAEMYLFLYRSLTGGFNSFCIFQSCI